MSADDATTTDTLTRDTDPRPRHDSVADRGTTDCSNHTRRTAAYWSMQRTMTDLS